MATALKPGFVLPLFWQTARTSTRQRLIENRALDLWTTRPAAASVLLYVRGSQSQVLMESSRPDAVADSTHTESGRSSAGVVRSARKEYVAMFTLSRPHVRNLRFCMAEPGDNPGISESRGEVRGAVSCRRASPPDEPH